MVFGAIQAIFFEKRQKIWISAFLTDFQKNGSSYAKMALRNPWDGPNDLFWNGFQPQNIWQDFWKSVPGTFKILQTTNLNQLSIVKSIDWGVVSDENVRKCKKSQEYVGN